jgi:hypothetical protein
VERLPHSSLERIQASSTLHEIVENNILVLKSQESLAARRSQRKPHIIIMILGNLPLCAKAMRKLTLQLQLEFNCHGRVEPSVAAAT